MDVRIGTSGWSYPEWKGKFYPESLPGSRMLPFYGERFAAVEVNATFYRLQSPGTFERWRAEVPAGFVFALKAWRRMTHQALLGPRALELLPTFLDVAAPLGDSLGPVLFQLPPWLPADAAGLDAFLDGVPAGLRAAFEFRHPSWFRPEVIAVLRRHRAALCIADSERLSTPVVATAGWGYLRLRRPGYGDVGLQRWVSTLLSQPWGEAFVFFKHEEAATGPRYAARFRELVEAQAVAAPPP